MFFVALLGTRIPAIRSTLENFVAELGQRWLEEATATPERWDQLMETYGKGFDPEAAAYNQIRKGVEQGAFRVRVNRDWIIGIAWRSAECVMPCLLARNWAILTSPGGEFVCSDRPVTVTFTSEELIRGWYPPGFGMAKTEVTVPLSRYVLLRGVFEPPGVEVAGNRKQIAYYNSWRLIQAQRFVFSCAPDFSWLNREHNVALVPKGLRDFLNPPEGIRHPA